MALNEKRRPPFTTLAQRLTLMTRSTNSDLGASEPRGGTGILLEIEPAGARSVGERLHAPVIEVAAAVERHLRDALRLRPLGEQLADRRADGGLALALDAPLQVVTARCRGERDAARVVDDLGVDVGRAAVDRQTRTLRGALDAAPDAISADAPPLELVVLSAHDVLPAALPALRRMYSPSYFTPLPL